MNRSVYEFCYKYDAIIGPSQKVHKRVRRLSFRDWDKDPSILQKLPQETVPMVEIHMPEDRFRALIEHDDWLYKKHMGSVYPGEQVSIIVKEHENEAMIRHQNPSVQRAYEQYKMLLELAR